MVRSAVILLAVTLICSSFATNSDLGDLEAEIALTENQADIAQYDEDLDVTPFEADVEDIFDDELYTPTEYDDEQQSLDDYEVGDIEEPDREFSGSSVSRWFHRNKRYGRHWRNKRTWNRGNRGWHRGNRGWHRGNRSWRRGNRGWRRNNRGWRRHVIPLKPPSPPQLKSGVKCQSRTFVGGNIDHGNNYVNKTIIFSPCFKKVPAVFTGIQQIESNGFNDKTIEVKVEEKSPSFMRLKISTVDVKDVFVNWMACA